MQILAITARSGATYGEDYLADMVLYGLRKRHGAGCVDWPKKDVMYKSCAIPTSSLYGRGFTLWKLLDDTAVTAVDREQIEDSLAAKIFDVVVFTSIHRQMDRYTALADRGLLDGLELRFVDGEDAGWCPPIEAAFKRGPYFKREDHTVSEVRPISFAIPHEKLLSTPAAKSRLFATHVQVEEAYRHPWIADHCRGGYAFEDEASYRSDLSTSYFAVTARKGGWDCMRHYEQAASLAVPCFYRLGTKSRTSAPHGLVDGENCVIFDSAEELDQKTTSLLEGGHYDRVMRGTGAWITERTCEALADYVIRARSPGPFGPSDPI